MAGAARVVDYLNRPISLEKLVLAEDKLLDKPSKSQQRWDEFHLKYLSDVSEIVSFRGIDENTNKLPKDARKTFERIFHEYHQNPQLREYFGSYNAFFHCFFTIPYGIQYSDGRYIDCIPQLMKKRHRECATFLGLNVAMEDVDEAEKKINEIEEEIKIINFARGINLPQLLFSCLERYDTQPPQKQVQEGIKATYKKGNTLIETTLMPSFATSVWEDIFSENDECIFIRKRKNTNGTAVLKFQKYWFASLLHCVHPRIRYLNIVPSTQGIPNPLFRVKLMSAKPKHLPNHLIVGGVLGENFRNVDCKEGIEKYIDSCIVAFSKQNKDAWGNIIIYNFSHAPGNDKTYNNFVKYIRTAYSVVDPESITLRNMRCEKEQQMRVQWRTEDKDQTDIIEKISNVGDYRYSGEQYSETFSRGRDTGLPGAFCNLEGTIRGYESDFHFNKAFRAKAGRIIKGAAIFVMSYMVLSSLGEYGYSRIEQYINTHKYSATIIGPRSSQSTETNKKVIVKKDTRKTPELLKVNTDQLEEAVNEALKYLCDNITLDGQEYHPGLSGENLICPIDTSRTTDYAAYDLKFDGKKQYAELIRIPLQDIVGVEGVIIQSPAALMIEYPWQDQLEKIKQHPAVGIRTRSGNSYLLIGGANESWFNKSLSSFMLTDILSRYMQHKK
jgi:hypothetical protein